MRPLLPAIALIVTVTACGAPPPPAASPSPTTPAMLEPQPPVEGLPYDDPRLGPVFAELRAHPEWLDEPIGAPTVIALVPSIERLCLVVRGAQADDVFVSILPGTPWTVQSVAIGRGDAGREIMHDTTGQADDICAFVVMGRQDPWPESDEPIEVTGNVTPDQAVAIARAVFVEPESFGIDRRGLPSILVGDASVPAPAGWDCRKAVVFVGGPRSGVVIGARPAAEGGSDVSVRLVEAALRSEAPRSVDGC